MKARSRIFYGFWNQSSIFDVIAAIQNDQVVVIQLCTNYMWIVCKRLNLFFEVLYILDEIIILVVVMQLLGKSALNGLNVFNFTKDFVFTAMDDLRKLVGGVVWESELLVDVFAFTLWMLLFLSLACWASCSNSLLDLSFEDGTLHFTVDISLFFTRHLIKAFDVEHWHRWWGRQLLLLSLYISRQDRYLYLIWIAFKILQQINLQRFLPHFRLSHIELINQIELIDLVPFLMNFSIVFLQYL